MRAGCAARSAASQAERDRLRHLLERLHEGVVTLDQDLVVDYANGDARRALGAARGRRPAWRGLAGALSARARPDALRGRSASAQRARVPDEEHAYGVVGIPAQPESRLGPARARRSLGARAPRAGRAGVRGQRGPRAAHAARRHQRRRRGPAGRREGGRSSATASWRTSSARPSGSAGSHRRCSCSLARSREEAPRLVPVELRPLIDEVAADCGRRRRHRQDRLPDGLRRSPTATWSTRRWATSPATRAKHTRQRRIVLARVRAAAAR